MFKVGEDIQAYPEKDVVGIFMSAGVKTREAQATSPARSVPAGTAMVIRMTDSINSSKYKVGHRFRGQLEGAAAVGLLIGRSSGAKTGAAVGLGGLHPDQRIEPQCARRHDARHHIACTFPAIKLIASIHNA
jgi:hypothetical protein